MLTTPKSWLYEFLLQQRCRLWSHRALRRGLPKTDESSAIQSARSFYSHMLKQTIPQNQSKGIDVVWDIGCQQWYYAETLAQHFKNAQLIGVELDAWRLYWSGYRRIDMANAYAAKINKGHITARCLGGDFLEVTLSEYMDPEQSVAVCFFYPFVNSEQCFYRKLPATYAAFGKLLLHAKESAEELGAATTFFSCHFGEDEADRAEYFYDQAGISVSKNIITVSESKDLWPSITEETHIYVSR